MVERQSRHCFAFAVKGDDLLKIEVCQGVAGNHNERLVQKVFGVLDAAGGAERRLFHRVMDHHPELRPIAEIVLNRVRHVLEGHNDVGDAMSFEEPKDVLHDWRVDDWNHWLWSPDGQGPQP